MSILGMLDDRYRTIYLDYIGAITGQAVDDPRWRICLSATRNNFGNAVGAMYARRYLDGDARETVGPLRRNEEKLKVDKNDLKKPTFAFRPSLWSRTYERNSLPS